MSTEKAPTVSKERREIKPPCFVQVADIKDLARLACAIERIPLPIFAIESGNNFLLSVQLDLFMGRPIFYYVKSKGRGQYLGYKNIGSAEEVALTDSPVNPTFVYAPIIAIKKLPAPFEDAIDNPPEIKEKFLSFEVSDLPSLAKITSYKVLFEEPPLPLYSFKIDGKWVAGAFARIDDYEEASIFFFVKLDKGPPDNFLKYPMQKTDGTAFTNRADEHGYIFIKVIKLGESHPLVEL